MAQQIFMVISDRSGVVLPGESTAIVFDPYLKRTVTAPVEVFSLTGETEQTFTFDSTGGGVGKVVFDPFTITKPVDAVSQATFLAQAQGLVWKYVDLLFVQTGGGDPGSGGLKPYLSYRLGTVGVSDLVVSSDDGSVIETVSFTFGQLQVGYQQQKPDGTTAAFVPVGWDRVKNVKI